MMTPRNILACLVVGLSAGCAGVSVVKDPGADDGGIRYWRPKPYLLVTPADATGRMVKIKLEYLPDFSEEYSITPKGKKPPQIQLKDGWNLVAVGGPAPPPEPAEAAPAPPPPGADPMKLPEYVVAATNVPIGYYESVFDVRGSRKILKGWRYIGMSPIGGGDSIGVDPPAPNQPPGCPPLQRGSSMPGPLYGMVFFNGVMTFRTLDEIANNMTCPQYVKIIPDKPEPVVVPPPETRMKPDQPTDPDTRIKVDPDLPVDEMKLDEATPPAIVPEVVVPPIPSPAPPESTSLNLTPAPSGTEDRAVQRTSISIPPPKAWASLTETR
ncbi:hypothetical protein [Paludisphaera soli]|uniref:hypothetical protein n=1 Tax=Paludisphaera soli TaxID=2712865 RepID=UPI0013EB3A90|nr:hypothetical protein [Paludisphaera soli]